jgi:hypothetical protein
MDREHREKATLGVRLGMTSGYDGEKQAMARMLVEGTRFVSKISIVSPRIPLQTGENCRAAEYWTTLPVVFPIYERADVAIHLTQMTTRCSVPCHGHRRLP